MNGKNVVLGLVLCFKLDGPHFDLKLNCGGKAFGVDASPWIVDVRYLVATTLVEIKIGSPSKMVYLWYF